MSTFEFLLQGLAVAFQPMNLLFAFIGVMLGTAVGVLPGIGPALTVALLLPATYKLDPGGSLIMFAGIYYGGMYGGSTTSILLNTPGESSSIVTALEGNKMARAGRGAAALATAAIGSFVAGTIATLALTFAAPAVAELAFYFKPTDYFAITALAFCSVAVVMGTSCRTCTSTRTSRGSSRSTAFTRPTSTPWNSTGAPGIRPDTASRVRIS